MAAAQRTSSSISAVLPAYNEEAIIEQTVRHVAGVLSGLANDFEVIVTNDGSRDSTGAVLADLQRREPDLHLQIVTHEQYGAVLQKGSKLTPEISAAIKKLWADGTISKLQKKWFNLDFSKLPNLK